jgi:hypothetical protein
MRAFIVACIAAIAIAVIGAFVLGKIQQSVPIRRFRLRLCALASGDMPGMLNPASLALQ